MKRYEFVLTPPHQRGSGGKEDEEKRKLHAIVKARDKGKKPPQRVSSAPARAPWAPPKKNIGEDIWKLIDEFRGENKGEKKKKYDKMIDEWSKYMMYAENENKTHFRAFSNQMESLREYVVDKFLAIGSKSGAKVWDKLYEKTYKKMRTMHTERVKQFPQPPHPGSNTQALKDVNESTDKYLKIDPGKFGKNRPSRWTARKAFDDWFNIFMEDIIVKQIKDPSWRPPTLEQRVRSRNPNLTRMEQGELNRIRKAKQRTRSKK